MIPLTHPIPAPRLSPALHIARVPGELGPVVRCSGELTTATGEALRREIDLLTSLSHPTLILNVAGCRSLDVDGVLLLLETYRSLREQGRRAAVVAGTGTPARVLRTLGIDEFLPVFPTEHSAALALRGGGPPLVAALPWSEARAETLATWRAILESLATAPADDLMRRITSPHGLCRRAEEVARAAGAANGSRCEKCPLFHALGARPEDVGCRSATEPMLESLVAGDREVARAQVARLIRLIEQLPLPPDLTRNGRPSTPGPARPAAGSGCGTAGASPARGPGAP